MAFPIDLVDAVLQNLRGGQAAAAFGDTYNPGPPATGTMKFFGDYAAEVTEPYLIVGEPTENRQYFSRDGSGAKQFIADGSLAIAIFASARDVARSLGDVVSSSLNDAVLTWTGVSNLMLMRITSAFFVPTPAVGPGVPVTFNRVLTMSYAYQGEI